MGFFLEVADRRPAGRRALFAGRARLRADLQGLRRVQLRAGRDGAVRGAGAGRALDVRAVAWPLLALALPCVAAVDHGRARLAIERLVLRQLVNQEGIIAVHGDARHRLLPRRLRPDAVRAATSTRSTSACPRSRCSCSRRRSRAACWSTRKTSYAARDRRPCWSPCWRCSSRGPRIGRALRAVADDHQAAQSVGIPLNHIWVIVWSVAGLVALVAGVIWGSKLGVQFSLSLVALKALPVVILGGFTSVPGAIVGGLIIGVGEKLSEVYLGPHGRRRHRELVRLRAGAALPAGPAAGPVRREASSSGSEATHALPRGRPVQDQLPRPTSRSSRSCRTASSMLALLAGRLRRRAAASPASTCFRAILIPFLILSLAAIGLNILVGYCGQISLGTGAFMAVGAYAAYNLAVRIAGMPLVVASCSAGLCATVVGVAVRHARACASRASTSRSRRWRRSSSSTGLFLRVKWFTNYSPSGSVSVARRSSCSAADRHAGAASTCFVPGVRRACSRCSPRTWCAATSAAQWMAIRDMDIAAEVIGIRPMYAKLTAFAVSSFYRRRRRRAVGLRLPRLVGAARPSTSTARSSCCSW